MFRVLNNGVIEMVRGDSFKHTMYLNKGSRLEPVEYLINDDDVVYFALEECNQPFEFAILKKKYTKADTDVDGRVVLVFEPSDTAQLLPGKYNYEVKIRSISGDTETVNTVVPRTEFFIME